MAVALAGAAAVPALAQYGEPAGDATGISRALGTGTMQSLFPQIVMPLPQTGGGFSGVQDRFKTRETNVPNRQAGTLINVGIPYINAIFGGFPEGAGLAGGIELTTADKLGKQVELYADAIYSTRNYRRLEVGALVGKERDRGEVRFRYTRRVADNLFGLGPFSESPPVFDEFSGRFVGGETNYDHEERSFQAGYSHYFVENKLALGGYVDFTSASFYEGHDDGDPSVLSLYQPYLNGIECQFPNVSEAFYSSQLPGLGTGSRIFTYGVYTEADYRDNSQGLTQGFYGYARFAVHDGVDPVPSFTVANGTYNFGWNQFTVDLRGYIPVFGNKNSIAMRYYTDLNDTRGGDVIPFYDLARLGGAFSLRGFDTYRFIGANSILFQGEYRRTLKTFGKSEDAGIDVNFFADAGQVWGKGYDPRCVTQNFLDRGDTFDFDNFEVDAGIGFTARISKAFALRFDYAHSNEEDKYKFVFLRGF
jgi:hypothetical protein